MNVGQKLVSNKCNCFPNNDRKLDCVSMILVHFHLAVLLRIFVLRITTGYLDEVIVSPLMSFLSFRRI